MIQPEKIKQFEDEWEARVNFSHNQKVRLLTQLDWYCNTHPEEELVINTIPVMKVTIGEGDLNMLITKLQDLAKHEQAQQRYPQLKEAYMNYLSLYYLTVDQDNY